MTTEGKTLKVCSCNRTVAIDAAALGAALKAGAPLSLHHQLCRKDAGAFQAALGQAEDVVVGCTQEAPLFGELAAGSNVKVRFV
ncbi:MAG TPA: 4Fe-4S ferredoxin, partial [Burkholderiales bacterium]|nr:4Fe-4S ferredoxin [Burkholderiales bacterium]